MLPLTSIKWYLNLNATWAYSLKCLSLPFLCLCLSFACVSKVLGVLTPPSRSQYALTLKHTCTKPPPTSTNTHEPGVNRTQGNHPSHHVLQKKCTGYPLWVNASQNSYYCPPSITSYCFWDYYLAMISEGTMKTAGTGSSGNWVGSPTFSLPQGGFLSGEIFQHDGNTGAL